MVTHIYSRVNCIFYSFEVRPMSFIPTVIPVLGWGWEVWRQGDPWGLLAGWSSRISNLQVQWETLTQEWLRRVHRMLTSGLHPAHTCTYMHRYLHTQKCVQRDTLKKDRYSHQRTPKEEESFRERGPGHLNVCPVFNSQGTPTLFSMETSGKSPLLLLSTEPQETGTS